MNSGPIQLSIAQITIRGRQHNQTLIPRQLRFTTTNRTSRFCRANRSANSNNSASRSLNLRLPHPARGAAGAGWLPAQEAADGCVSFNCRPPTSNADADQSPWQAFDVDALSAPGAIDFSSASRRSSPWKIPKLCMSQTPTDSPLRRFMIPRPTSRGYSTRTDISAPIEGLRINPTPTTHHLQLDA